MTVNKAEMINKVSENAEIRNLIARKLDPYHKPKQQNRRHRLARL
jgi:hypothetical protein